MFLLHKHIMPMLVTIFKPLSPISPDNDIVGELVWREM